MAALLLPACSDDPSEVDPDALAEGPCRQLAVVLTDVGQVVESLRGDGLDREEADGRLERAQPLLREVGDQADGEVTRSVDDLANDLGVLRVALATDQVGDEVLDQVAGGRDEVLAACAPTG